MRRCPAGHFYDPARHADCPVCAGAVDEQATTMLRPGAVAAAPPPTRPDTAIGWLEHAVGALGQLGRDTAAQARRLPAAARWTYGIGLLTGALTGLSAFVLLVIALTRARAGGPALAFALLDALGALLVLAAATALVTGSLAALRAAAFGPWAALAGTATLALAAPVWALLDVIALVSSAGFAALPWPARLGGILGPLAWGFLFFCLFAALLLPLWRQRRR